MAAFFAASTCQAALTFDLRAVSGSQITIHGPKSVAVNQNSVGGWIDFELWALVTGSNGTPADDWIELFVGSMLSDHYGNGAISGSMVNTGEVAPHAHRGVIAPFDANAYQDGWLQNLDNDADLEIGGRTRGETEGMIGGRTGRDIYYFGNNSIADFLLYRFTLPVAGINAQTLADITSVHFRPEDAGTYYLWEEDDVPKNAVRNSPHGGQMSVGEPVLIHTAQTPEELAMIPEPGTWLLALLGMVGAGWLAIRRRA